MDGKEKNIYVKIYLVKSIGGEDKCLIQEKLQKR